MRVLPLYRVYSVLCLVSWTVAAEDADLENGYGGGGKGAEDGCEFERLLEKPKEQVKQLTQRTHSRNMRNRRS